MNPPAEIERLAAATAATAGRNPAIVLDAFCPPEGLRVDMLSLLRLERIGSPILTGGPVRLTDWLLAYAVLTDWPRFEKLWKKNTPEAWIEQFAAARPALDMQHICQSVSVAIEAALAPAAADSPTGGLEKKSNQAVDGGSMSSPVSAPTTSGAPGMS